MAAVNVVVGRLCVVSVDLGAANMAVNSANVDRTANAHAVNDLDVCANRSSRLIDSWLIFRIEQLDVLAKR